LILAELLPQRANLIFKRGVAYTQSRVVCNVHWYSDILAGRLIGTTVFSLLHTKLEFLQDMKLAKEELLYAKRPDRMICKEEKDGLHIELGL